MTTLLLASPLLVVVLLLASGRANAFIAGGAGAVLAAGVAMTVAPQALSIADAGWALANALWLAWLVGSVIFGGLFLHNTLAETEAQASTMRQDMPDHRRRRLFAACFLIGPFTESATGFGVGYVIALSLIARLGVPTRPMLILGLFSQTFVPWGALAVGTTVGALLTHLPIGELGVRSALLTVPLLLIWLCFFWHFAGIAGLPANRGQKLDDLCWILANAVLLIGSNLVLDPQVAAVAVLGPLIAVRFWRDERPSSEVWQQAIRSVLPYAALITVLIATRAVPTLREFATTHLVIKPNLPGAPAYPILFHPFVWLLVIPIAVAFNSRAGTIAPTLGRTWQRAWRSIGATASFLIIAQFLAVAGIASALAAGFVTALGPHGAVTLSPIFAAIGGLLTGSTSGANGLFMTSQVALAAAAGVADIGWLAAIQNTTASAFSMLSPIRVSMGCAALGYADMEPGVYRTAWPLVVVPLLLMAGAASVLVWTAGP